MITILALYVAWILFNHRCKSWILRTNVRIPLWVWNQLNTLSSSWVFVQSKYRILWWYMKLHPQPKCVTLLTAGYWECKKQAHTDHHGSVHIAGLFCTSCAGIDSPVAYTYMQLLCGSMQVTSTPKLISVKSVRNIKHFNENCLCDM